MPPADRVSLSPRPVVLSFSRLARDRRVLRQCDLLRDLGRSPRAIAYAEPGDVLAHDIASRPAPRPTTTRRIATLLRQTPAHLGLAAARAGFWAEPGHRWALAELRRARPGFVVANDWPALVVAARWKAESGARLHYDSHEFATREFEERAYWRLVWRPMVAALERDAIGRADTISTVGPGIARALAGLYALPRLPVVLRSVGERIDLTHVAIEPAWPLRVLYHGFLMPHRGLEALIDSALQWREPHTLLLRGDGEPGYVASLRARAAPAGARIAFEPAVAAEQVIPRAAETADIGVFLSPCDTVQHRFTMPNKLFEYIGAGLAVLVSPADDMRALVEAHGVGLVTTDAGAAAATAAVDALTPERVSAFRIAARRAAAELCWERERETLAAIFRAALA